MIRVGTELTRKKRRKELEGIYLNGRGVEGRRKELKS